jgi:predicted RNase H-like HicB family nuclease
MTDYPIILFHTPSDGLWMAKVPDLPGCSAHGETPEEALREVKIAMELWLEIAHEIGKPIPSPTLQPELCAAG